MIQICPSDLQPPALAISELCSIVRTYALKNVEGADHQMEVLQTRMNDQAATLDSHALAAAMEELCSVLRAFGQPGELASSPQVANMQIRCAAAANNPSQSITVQWLGAQIEELFSIVRAYVPEVDKANNNARILQEKMHCLAGAIDLQALAGGIEELASIVATFCPANVQSQTAALLQRMTNLHNALNDPRPSS